MHPAYWVLRIGILYVLEGVSVLYSRFPGMIDDGALKCLEPNFPHVGQKRSVQGPHTPSLKPEICAPNSRPRKVSLSAEAETTARDAETLHFKPQSSEPKHKTQDTKPFGFGNGSAGRGHPKHQAPNPNLKPQTPNLKHQTPNRSGPGDARSGHGRVCISCLISQLSLEHRQLKKDSTKKHRKLTILKGEMTY